MVTLSDFGLEKYRGDEQYERFLRALNIFSEEEKEKQNTDTILVFGSFVRGELSKYSDIDVLVIDESIDSPVEKTYIEEGVEINTLYLTWKKLEERLEKEKGTLYQKHITMISEGRVLYSKDATKIELLKQRLREGSYARIVSFGAEEKEKLQTFLKREEEMLGRYLEVGDVLNFSLRFNYSLSMLVEKYFLFLGQPLPQYKKTSEKILDEEFRGILKQALTAREMQEKYENLQKLIKCLETLSSL